MSIEREDLFEVFGSVNEADSKGEPANVVDGLFFIARGLHAIASAIQEHASIMRADRP